MQPYSCSQHIRATHEVFPWEQDDGGGKLWTRGGRKILCSSLVCVLLREKYSRENRQPSVIGQSSWCSMDKSCLFCSPALKTREKVPFIFRGGD